MSQQALLLLLERRRLETGLTYGTSSMLTMRSHGCCTPAVRSYSSGHEEESYEVRAHLIRVRMDIGLDGLSRG